MPKDKDSHSRSSARKSGGDRDRDLANFGVEPISADDYFLKSDNFRLWLRKEKGKVSVPFTSASSAEALTDSTNHRPDLIPRTMPVFSTLTSFLGRRHDTTLQSL